MRVIKPPAGRIFVLWIFRQGHVLWKGHDFIGFFRSGLKPEADGDEIENAVIAGRIRQNAVKKRLGYAGIDFSSQRGSSGIQIIRRSVEKKNHAFFF
jgi:hypothetical protein